MIEMNPIQRHAAVAAILICVSGLLVSCGGRRSGLGLLGDPASIGNPYEVLVVSDDSFQGSAAAQTLDSLLNTPVVGLPQAEAQFRVSHVDEAHFRTTFKMFRNIIRVEVSPQKFTRTALKQARDMYAQSQVMLVVRSNSNEALQRFLQEHGNVVTGFFVKAELAREEEKLEKKHSIQVAKLAQQMFGCRIYVPKELVRCKKGKSFFWASTDTREATINVCMYAYPYKGEEIMTQQKIVSVRDSFMRANIPGAEKGMYMCTQPMGLNLLEKRSPNGKMWELRGLWEMKNDAMGGPFISHSVVDEPHRRVLVTEVFAYAPGRAKRDIMGRLEAALKTMRLNNGDKSARK